MFYEKIIFLIKNKATLSIIFHFIIQKFINLYFGNNAINSMELRDIIPIYNFNK